MSFTILRWAVWGRDTLAISTVLRGVVTTGPTLAYLAPSEFILFPKMKEKLKGGDPAPIADIQIQVVRIGPVQWNKISSSAERNVVLQADLFYIMI